MTSYQIQVFASLQTAESGCKLVERIVSLPETIDFDYKTVTTALKILYGTKVVIRITIMP